MPRIEAEIFEEYLKIQEQQGFITKADYASARRGSDNKETIELLYGIKLEPEKILEKAHPETSVVSPAHDKMNGIVENLQQRQNIMTQIALKTPTGENTMHRYVTAHERLTMELYKVASLLDSKDEKKLMVQADKCLEKAASPLAAIPALVWWIGGALGGLALFNRTDNIALGVVTDSKTALDELADLTEIQGISNITNFITRLHGMASQFGQVKRIVIDKSNISNGLEKYEEEQKFINEYIKTLNEAAQKLPRFVQFIEASEGNDLTMEEGGWLSKVEYAGRIALSIRTDKQDVIEALQALNKSVQKELQYTSSFIENAKTTFAPIVQQIAETNPQSVGLPAMQEVSTMLGG